MVVVECTSLVGEVLAVVNIEVSSVQVNDFQQSILNSLGSDYHNAELVLPDGRLLADLDVTVSASELVNAIASPSD